MRLKFIGLFFIILLGYAVVLLALPYVSVYYTYFAIPALVAVTGLWFREFKKSQIKGGIYFCRYADRLGSDFVNCQLCWRLFVDDRFANTRAFGFGHVYGTNTGQ